MQIILSLPQVLLGSGLSMVFGVGLLLITLARISHGVGDTCPIVGWADGVGQTALFLAVIAACVALLS